MNKKVTIVLIILLSFGCSFKKDIEVNSLNDDQLKISMINKIFSTILLEFNTVDQVSNNVSIEAQYYRKGKLEKTTPLLSVSEDEEKEKSFTYDISMMKVDDYGIFINTSYNTSALGTAKFKFLANYDFYDYSSVGNSFNIEKNKEYYLSYYAGGNHSTEIPNTISELKIQNYEEIIIIKLLT